MNCQAKGAAFYAAETKWGAKAADLRSDGRALGALSAGGVAGRAVRADGGGLRARDGAPELRRAGGRDQPRPGPARDGARAGGAARGAGPVRGAVGGDPGGHGARGGLHELPQVENALLARDDVVHELLGRDAGGLRLRLDLLAVLVGAGQEHVDAVPHCTLDEILRDAPVRLAEHRHAVVIGKAVGVEPLGMQKRLRREALPRDRNGQPLLPQNRAAAVPRQKQHAVLAGGRGPVHVGPDAPPLARYRPEQAARLIREQQVGEQARLGAQIARVPDRVAGIGDRHQPDRAERDGQVGFDLQRKIAGEDLHESGNTE